jgi:hypothetical protein
MLAQTNAS